MSIPLATLEDNKKNVYELTCAAIKRAKQIAITGDEELEDKSNKITSISLDQILTENDIPHSVLQSWEEVLEDKQAWANDVYYKIIGIC